MLADPLSPSICFDPADPFMLPQNPLSQRAKWAGGQPISYLMHLALARPELISLAAGFVDQNSLPVAATEEATRVLLADPVRAKAALQYGTTAGFMPLREQLLAMLKKSEASPTIDRVTVDQIVVTAGSNQLLHLLGDTVLDPGDIVLCGSPTYFVFLGVLANLGCRAVGVATDDDGMRPQALEEQLRRLESAGELGRVKAVYLTSYYDNPTSVTLARERRPQIVEIVQRWSKDHRIYLIEDAAYLELRYAGDDLPSLRSFDKTGETVVYAGTFSKSFSPGVRVGWGILPPALLEPVKHQKGNIDFGSPNFSQHLMSTVLELGLFEPQVKRLRTEYSQKLQAMLEAAEQFLSPLPGVRWTRPTGGLYVWLQLPEEIDTGPAGPLLDRALAEGVLYVPGRYCYPNEGETPRHNMIRLSFGVQSPGTIRQGMELLSRAIKQL